MLSRRLVAALLLMAGLRAGTAASAAPAATMTSPASAAASRAIVACYMASSQENGYFSRPRNCTFENSRSNGSDASRVRIRSLRWRDWGERTTRARGRLVGRDGETSSVQVTLSKSERCEGQRLYRRARVVSRGSTLYTIPLIGCAV